MNVTMSPPDLRGTVVLFNVTLRLTRQGLRAHGSFEIQPVFAADDDHRSS